MLPPFLRTCAVLVLALLAGTGLCGDGPPGADEWKYDVVYLRKGGALRGVVLEQDRNHVKIKMIRRRPGSPTLMLIDIVQMRDVRRVEVLEGAERALLLNRLEALKREREALAGHLKSLGTKGKGPSGEAVNLVPIDWQGKADAKGVAYLSAHFRLESNARAEVVQLAAIHLEQIYAAYARALPPRALRATPTTILLTKSLADYRTLAQQRGLNLFNPAFYDPARNQVVCGSDLERACDERSRLRAHHAQLRKAIHERKIDLRKAYRGRVPAELLAPLIEADRRITDSENKNDRSFAAVRQRLFQVLYHEAFHAYLCTFVYPTPDGAFPHWFNEGLAQIFETAIVEVGELRVGHADGPRLAEARVALTRGSFPKLTDLLRSGPKQFVVAHASDQQVSDSYYLASWALAFYLTFDRKLLATDPLDNYVHALKRGTEPVAAFRALVGGPSLAAFESDFHAFVRALRPDGTTKR